MELSRIAILAVRGACPGIIKKLADAIEASESSIYKWISENHSNLTKAAAIKVIKEETGLTQEQILEEGEPATAK